MITRLVGFSAVWFWFSVGLVGRTTAAIQPRQVAYSGNNYWYKQLPNWHEWVIIKLCIHTSSYFIEGQTQHFLVIVIALHVSRQSKRKRVLNPFCPSQNWGKGLSKWANFRNVPSNFKCCRLRLWLWHHLILLTLLLELTNRVVEITYVSLDQDHVQTSYFDLRSDQGQIIFVTFWPIEKIKI